MYKTKRGKVHVCMCMSATVLLCGHVIGHESGLCLLRPLRRLGDLEPTMSVKAAALPDKLGINKL